MKLFILASILSVFALQVFGLCVPAGSDCKSVGCDCGGARHSYVLQEPLIPNLEHRHVNYDYSIKVADVDHSEPEATKYRFDFNLQEPKLENTAFKLKSYDYKVQTGVQPKCEETGPKYQFDYTLQEPIILHPEHTERDYSLRVEVPSVSTCQCNCKDIVDPSCPHHKTAAAERSESGEGQAYVLPIRYDDQRYDDENSRSRRSVRSGLFKKFPRKTKRQSEWRKLSERLELLRARTNEYINKIRKTRYRVVNEQGYKPKAIPRPNTASAEYTKAVHGNFKDNARPKRETSTEQSSEPEKIQSTLKIQPTLKIHEAQLPCSSMQNLKKQSEYRQDLQRPEVLQFMPELQSDNERTRKHCNLCGVAMNDNVCKDCGTKNYHPSQPQFFEFVQGEPVSYQPASSQQSLKEGQGTANSEPMTQAQRYVFDRFGHKYSESNGKLRLIAPAEYKQSDEATVGQPNYAGLARIMDNNQEVIHQMNAFGPDRMTPEPLDLTLDAIDFIRDLARRQADYSQKMRNTQSANSESMQENQDIMTPEFESELENLEQENINIYKNAQTNMYQIIPIMQDGKDGSLIIKISPTKSKLAPTNRSNSITKTKTKSTKNKLFKTKSSQKSNKIEVEVKDEKNELKKPNIHKISKDDYEILSVQTDPTAAVSSAEDVNTLLDYLYNENMKETLANESRDETVSDTETI